MIYAGRVGCKGMVSKIIRVAIADDHAIVRSGLANFLRAFPDVELVGEASNGREILELCPKVQPDVILMDLVMPEMSGVDAIRLIRHQYPQVQILALTSFDDEELVERALEAGAIGYILKNISIHEMVRAIHLAYQGKPILSPEAAQALIHVRLGPGSTHDLKDREIEVLQLMGEGLTNPQIAEHLSLSVATIKFYVSAILKKLEVETRTEAVVKAIEVGLIHRGTSPKHTDGF